MLAILPHSWADSLSFLGEDPGYLSATNLACITLILEKGFGKEKLIPF
jgi:hypothetical protein